MKRIVSLLLISCLCMVMTSCGAATITGEPATYQNKDGSFSIELPTENEKSWIVNEETKGDVLDITDAKETVNIVVQCVSKSKMAPVAGELTEYESFALGNTFVQYLEGTDLETAHVEVPDHMASYSAYTYAGNGVEGIVVFMESDKCYYTFLVRTVEDGYSVNKKAIEDSILSLQEITTVK